LMLKVAIFICVGFREEIAGFRLAAKCVLRRRRTQLVRHADPICTPRGCVADNVGGQDARE
jgi:hypothetical protein